MNTITPDSGDVYWGQTAKFAYLGKDSGSGNSVWLVIFAISAFAWMWPARLARGLFLVLREKEFVSASRALGASDARLIFLRILPNSLGPLLVSATLQMAYAIITESGLSYLGFGVQPPTPSWGLMLSSTGRAFMEQAPWMALWPGLALALVVYGMNMLGDGLRDVLDPRLRGGLAREALCGAGVEVEIVDGNRVMRNLQPFAEPQLGKRGLYLPQHVGRDTLRRGCH